MAVYSGYIPNNTVLFSGDYTTSPSGTYYAIFSPYGAYQGQLQVERGSNPSVSSPNNIANAISATPIQSGTFGGYYADMQEDGNFVIYGSQNGQPVAPVQAVYATNTAGLGATVYGQVSDNGSFSLFTGGSPSTQGQMVYSNGVSDPVKSLALTGLNYNLNNVVVTPTGQLSGESLTQTNKTQTSETATGTLTLTYSKTETFQWALSQAVTLGVSSTTNVGVPGLIAGSSTVSVSETTTVSFGHSDAETTGESFSAAVALNVPGNSEYEALLVGQQVSFSVPYTFTGVATYASGATANVVGSGTYVGGDGADFQVETICLAGCPNGVTGPISEVPATSIVEPASALLLPTALLGTAVMRRFRRGASGTGRGGGGRMQRIAVAGRA
jgi:hypothetical protein